MDEHSPLAEQVEDAMERAAVEWGDLDVEVGVFQSGTNITMQ